MSWDEYLSATKDRPPSKLLVEAMEYARDRSRALELGPGALNDARFLHDQGFAVTAVDSNPDIRGYAADLPELDLHIETFQNYLFEENAFDLINAHYALPFIPPASFIEVFERIKASLKDGGILVGQFFGNEDAWAGKYPDMTFHTREEVEQLLQPFAVKVFREERGIGKTGVGLDKFWHVFHVIAEK